MRYLISGASGLIGTRLTTSLQGQGHDVRRLVRRAPNGPEEIHWDPRAQQLDPKSLEGFDGVVHLAGENVASGRWTRARMDEIESSRVLGTGLLARAIASCEARPPVLVSASAIGMYGDQGDAVLTETSSAGSGFLPDVCKVWESSADPAREAGVRVVHPRIGLVLAKEGGALQRMLMPFRLGVGGPIGSGENWMSWISIDDQVRVLERALTDANLVGPVNSVAPESVRFTEFARVLGRVLSRPAFLKTPAFAMRLAMGKMVDDLMLASVRVEPRALLDSGFRFEHPDLESALRAVLDRPEPAAAMGLAS